MHWDDLRYVLAVHTSGSVATAARRLGVSNVTVFRRLKALEKQLGVRLFDRTRKGYAATGPALEIVRQAERMEDEVGALERRIWGQDRELSGVVRITAPDSTGSFVVAPLIAELHRIHPGISVELKLDNRVFNMSKRDADIAIRPTTSPPENLIGHRLATLAHAPYAAARLLPRGKSRKLDLSDLPWVGIDSSYTGNRVTAYQSYLDTSRRPGRGDPASEYGARHGAGRQGRGWRRRDHLRRGRAPGRAGPRGADHRRTAVGPLDPVAPGATGRGPRGQRLRVPARADHAAAAPVPG